MKKRFRKFLAGCIIASMLPLMPVMATDEEDSFTEDFESVTISTLGWTKTGRLVDDPNFTARVSGGEYGKANSDKALVVEEKPNGANKAFGIEKAISLRNIAQGEKLHVSFEYLVSDFSGWKGVQIVLKSSNGEEIAINPILYGHRKNYPASEHIYYFGYAGNWQYFSDYDYGGSNTILNKWYKFDYFIDPSGSVDVYRNGTLLGTKSFAFTGGGTLTGITKFAVVNSGNAYTSSGTHHAVDNINIEYVTSVTAPSAPLSYSFNDFEMINKNTNSENSKPFTDVYFWDAWTVPISAGNYVRNGNLIYQMENNVFGKTGQSLHMFDTSATSGHAFVQPGEIGLNNGDKALISFEVAMDPNNGVRQRFGARASKNNNGSITYASEYELMSIYANGNLALCNEYAGTLKQSRWYRVDLVIDSATGTVTGYLNGRKVLDGAKPWSLASGEYIASIYQTRFQYYPDSNQGGIYYDNILFRNLGSGSLPEFDTTLTVSGTTAEVSGDTVTLLKATNISALSANGAPISVVNAEGQSVTSGNLSAGSKIYVTGPYGTPAIYSVQEKVYETLIDEDFNTAFASGTIPAPFSQFNMSGSSFNSGYQTELGGKGYGDGFYTFSVNNWNGDGTATRDPYIYYSIGRSVPYTLEASFLPGGDMNFVVAVLDASGSEQKVTLGNFSTGYEGIFMGSGGAIRVSNLHKNRWYKMAITMYPGTNYCDLWFNGRLVAEHYVIPSFADSTYGKIQYVRLHAWLDKGTEDNPLNVTIGLDDIKAYEGAYRGESSAVDFTTDLECNKNTHRFFVDEAMDIGEFISAVETDGEVRVYDDATLESALSGDYVEPGNLVVISSPDGEVYDYYKVYDLADRLIVTSGGEEAVGTISRGSVRAEYDNADAEGVLALAIYSRTGELLKLATNEDEDGDGVYSCETDAPYNSTAKVVFWDGLSTLQPLTDVKSFAAATDSAIEGPSASSLSLPTAGSESGSRSLVYTADSASVNRLSGRVAVHDSSDEIFYSGAKHEMAAEPYYKDSALMVPAQDLATAFGQSYSYNSGTGKIDFGTNVDMTVNSTTLVYGSTNKTMSTAPEVKNGTVMVPLKDVCEKGLSKTVTTYERGLNVIGTSSWSQTEANKLEVNNYMLYDRPKEAEIRNTIDLQRPRVILNPTSKSSIINAYKNNTDANIKRWGDSVIALADTVLKGSSLVYAPADGSSFTDVGKSFKARSMNLAMAYLLTGDEAYSKRLWKEIATVGSFPDWNPDKYLGLSEITVGFAVAYDWLYDVWTPAERAFMEACIRNNSLVITDRSQYGVQPTGGWWVTEKTNWNAVCNDGAILGAAAIYETDTALCSRVMQNSIRGLELLLNEFYPLGAWYEGATYWDYLMSHFANLEDTIENCFGTDFNLLSAPGLENTVKFSVYSAGFAGTDNFYDAEFVKGASAATYATHYWLAKKYDKPEFANLRMQKTNGSGGVADMLWYDTATQLGSINLPLDGYLYSGTLHYASTRGSWTDTNSPYLAFHCGAATVNHAHLDNGTYVIDMLGERWASDLGGDDYDLTGYFGTERFTYYRLRPEGHNVYVINPDSSEGQDPDASTYISRGNIGYSTGNKTFAIANLTNAYSANATSAKRGYRLADNRTSVVIRDEITLKKASDIYWFSHTDADIQIIDNNTAILTKNDKQVKFSIITNGNITLSVMDAEPLPTSPNPQGQASNSGYKKLCAKVSGSGEIYIQARWLPVDHANANTAQTSDPLSNWGNW